jgi:lipid-A-disaccharide synthase
MVNLIAGRRIVPELLQTNFTPHKVAAALRPLLDNTPERTQMLTELAEIRHILRPASSSSSIQQVCDAVESLLPGDTLKSGPNESASV